jgi:hypothetical protein
MRGGILAVLQLNGSGPEGFGCYRPDDLFNAEQPRGLEIPGLLSLPFEV